MKSEVSGDFNSAIGLLRFRVAGRFAIDPVRPIGPAGQIPGFAAFAAERAPGGLGELATAEHTDASRHGYNYRSKDPEIYRSLDLGALIRGSA